LAYLSQILQEVFITCGIAVHIMFTLEAGHDKLGQLLYNVAVH